MHPKTLDHINVHVPEEGVDHAVAFYRDVLGFETDNLEAYRAGDRSLFTFHPSEGCVVHVVPTDAFEPPGENFTDVSIYVRDPFGYAVELRPEPLPGGKR